MNYTRITINQKEVGIKFGMVSDRYLFEKLKSPYCFSGEDLTEIGYAHIIFSGYLNNCAHKDIALELTFEDIVDHIETSIKDADKMAAISAAIKIWSESQAARNGVEEEPKKKLATKKSKD
jgi:hypothetical protein